MTVISTSTTNEILIPNFRELFPTAQSFAVSWEYFPIFDLNEIKTVFEYLRPVVDVMCLVLKPVRKTQQEVLDYLQTQDLSWVDFVLVFPTLDPSVDVYTEVSETHQFTSVPALQECVTVMTKLLKWQNTMWSSFNQFHIDHLIKVRVFQTMQHAVLEVSTRNEDYSKYFGMFPVYVQTPCVPALPKYRQDLPPFDPVPELKTLIPYPDLDFTKLHHPSPDFMIFDETEIYYSNYVVYAYDKSILHKELFDIGVDYPSLFPFKQFFPCPVCKVFSWQKTWNQTRDNIWEYGWLLP
jgi:hypothetical protein